MSGQSFARRGIGKQNYSTDGKIHPDSKKFLPLSRKPLFSDGEPGVYLVCLWGVTRQDVFTGGAMRARLVEEPYHVLAVSAGKTPVPGIVPELPPDLKVELISAGELADEGKRNWAAHFDAVLLDARGSPPSDRRAVVGETLERLTSKAPRTRVLVLVGDDDLETASLAAARGAWDVLSPGASPAAIGGRLGTAARLRRLQEMGPKREPASHDVNPMIGTCDGMRRIFSLIRRVAATDVPVLISGESGTGKELAAVSIHERSARAAGPFVPINCSAIPEGLLESELFGHERGAFTGATTARPGRLEIAHGGTVFLDEIGELAPLLQAKLLRFLQDHLLERVGGRKSRPLDVRVVAATNCDLTKAVADNRFREDLFYRLAVFTIELPPLRDRGEDIPVLARFFLERYAEQAGKQIHGFSRRATDELGRVPWPGNVREMINRVRRSVVVADGPLVTPGDLGFGSESIDEPLLTLKEARVRAEIESLRRALQRTKGNRTEAARLLGISRTQFYDLVGRHRIGDAERS